ncbi:hypothetical protein ACFWGL_17030 [Streptomyces sp. NPDC060286]|uniref:hypothetical protein n=1 Tax=unclassified Streptomyces TaxID=2593676 RepID=UPI0035D7EDA5
MPNKPNLPAAEPCTDPRHTGSVRDQLGCTGPDPAALGLTAAEDDRPSGQLTAPDPTAAPAEEQPAGPTWQDRADHAIELYARTAVERDDARTEVARLRARVTELEAQQITPDQLTGPIRDVLTAYLDEVEPGDEEAEDMAYAVTRAIRQAMKATAVDVDPAAEAGR